MKNKEKIFDIICDIKVLENNIRARKAQMESRSGLDAVYVLKQRNKNDEYAIAKLEHTVKQLKKEDAKIWKEALAIAHGGIRAWWEKNGMIIQYFGISLLLVVGVVGGLAWLIFK